MHPHKHLTPDMITQKPSNDKVKLGWGWNPQFFTTTTIKFIYQGYMIFPFSWSALLKAYRGLLDPTLLKDLEHSVRSVPS